MLHRDPFVKTLEVGLRDVCRVNPGDRLLLAVSGGADSTALCRAAAVIADRPHWQLHLHVGHINHQLRDEADAEAAFVARLAEQLGLPFHHAAIAPAEDAGNLEAAARRLRYDALRRIAEDLDVSAVVTAHQADDQLETMLMRLIRGASVRGMSGMAPRRRLGAHTHLLRPMLRADHAAAVSFLDRLDQPWCEDASNTARTRWRARLRADVLPALRALRPDAAVKAVDTADRLRESAALTDARIRRALAAAIEPTDDGRRQLCRAAARRMSSALLRGVLRAALIESGARPDALGRRTLDPIVRALRDKSGADRRFTFGGGVTAVLQSDRLVFTDAYSCE